MRGRDLDIVVQRMLHRPPSPNLKVIRSHYARIRIKGINVHEAKEHGRLSIILKQLDNLRKIETLLIMHGATASETAQLEPTEDELVARSLIVVPAG